MTNIALVLSSLFPWDDLERTNDSSSAGNTLKTEQLDSYRVFFTTLLNTGLPTGFWYDDFTMKGQNNKRAYIHTSKRELNTCEQICELKQAIAQVGPLRKNLVLSFRLSKSRWLAVRPPPPSAKVAFVNIPPKINSYTRADSDDARKR